MTLDDTFTARLARRKEKSQLRQLTVVGPDMVDFSSNAYLSLSAQAKIHSDYLKFMKTWSQSSSRLEKQSFLGSGGSRLLDGNSRLAETIERTISAFHGAPAALLFNSGFDANVGLFSTAPQLGDVIVYDELIHASVHDGMKLSRAAEKMPFRHNTVFRQDGASGPTNSLDEVLEMLVRRDHSKGISEGSSNVFIAVEGIYSMDGDVAPLADVVESVKKWLPRGNGYIIVDEAHSTGLLGPGGRGLVCQFELEDEIFARVHTFGKAMGCSGAAVLSSRTTREYLVNYARTLIYTTSMALPSLASIKITYDFLARGNAEPLIDQLNDIVDYTYKSLHLLCTRTAGHSDLLHLAPKRYLSPIIPLFTTEPRDLAKHCHKQGFMVRPIMAPTVPSGTERIRVCLHAANTREEVDGLLRAIGQWLDARLISMQAEKTMTLDVRAKL